MSKARRPRNGPSHRSERDYEVGRGKPPAQTQFKPGQSGNPKGRPKGVRNFKTDVQATLNTPVKVSRDGKRQKLSTQEAMLLRLREKALSGDARALDRLITLAQAYNNEELVTAASLYADDAMVLEVFKARVLSGAATSGSTALAADESHVSRRSSDPPDTEGALPGEEDQS